jgi:hypothetical protein
MMTATEKSKMRIGRGRQDRRGRLRLPRLLMSRVNDEVAKRKINRGTAEAAPLVVPSLARIRSTESRSARGTPCKLTGCK